MNGNGTRLWRQIVGTLLGGILLAGSLGTVALMTGHASEDDLNAERDERKAAVTQIQKDHKELRTAVLAIRDLTTELKTLVKVMREEDGD